MTRAKELLDAATPRPWDTDISPDGRYSWLSHNGTHITGAGSSREVHIDHALIVYAVNTLPAYEAAVEALDKLVAYQDEEPPDHSEAFGAWWDRWYAVLDEAREALRRLQEQTQ